jgi:hypothetical protein
MRDLVHLIINIRDMGGNHGMRSLNRKRRSNMTEIDLTKPLKKTQSEWNSMMEYILKRCSKAKSIEILQCVWRGIEIIEEESQ